MWEHGGCLECVQQDAISKCGYLDRHDIGTGAMWPRAEGTRTISRNETGGCGFKLCYFSVLALEEGRCVHQEVIQSGLELDVFVGSSLVDMYAKCGSMDDAWRVFNKMPFRIVVSWSTILGGCAMHGHGKEALKYFEQMCEEGV